MALDTARVGEAKTRAHPPAQMPWLVAALGIGAITFVVATAYAQHAAATVEDGAAVIMADASPTNDAGVRQRVSALERQGHGARTIAFALDALGVGLVLAMVILALRTMRIHAEQIAKRERELEHRADAFEQFAARVAHDLANPLGAALLNLQSLERTADYDPTTHDKVVRTRRAVMRCNDMIEGLMRFARAGAHPEPGAATLVGDVVREIAEQIGDTEGSELTIDLEPLPRCAVACSRGVLTSILSNLLENAAKYTRGCDERRIVVRAYARGARVRVEVDDTGPGVPKDAGATIFEPYVRGAREHESGMGLGLATVKRLCDAHGGEAGIDETVPRGSRFWFELPRRDIARAAAVQAHVVAAP